MHCGFLPGAQEWGRSSGKAIQAAGKSGGAKGRNTMKTIRISTLMKLAMVTLLAVCFNTGRASAQEVAGTFTLPYEAHWGRATLPPGDYSFRLNSPDFEGILLSRGTNKVALILDRGRGDEKSSRNELIVDRTAAGCTIRELHLPKLGIVLYYGERKTRGTSAARESEVAQVVPLKVAGM